MSKINESYEAMVIFSSKLDEEAVNTLTAEFNDLIEANASDVTLSNWGKRKLAYAINYETEGTYVLWSFTSTPEFPAELERILGAPILSYSKVNKLSNASVLQPCDIVSMQYAGPIRHVGILVPHLSIPNQLSMVHTDSDVGRTTECILDDYWIRRIMKVWRI